MTDSTESTQAEPQVHLGDLAPHKLAETTANLHAWLDAVDNCQRTLMEFTEAMGIHEMDYGTAVVSERVDEAIDHAHRKLGIVSWLQHRQGLKAVWKA